MASEVDFAIGTGFSNASEANSFDCSSLSSCATTVIGDDRFVDVSSCSISIASTSSRMSQQGSRPSSQAAQRDIKDGIKERVEERLRQCKERQEEDRQRKLAEIELSTQQKQRYCEQLEQQRRRKIDELKARDLDKRNAVEERKRLIWEAEQSRKEALLRRNNELDSKLEAKKFAHRNLSSFAFGSSTPRTINLDMAVLGPTRQNNALLLSAAPSKPLVESVDIDKHRPVSAYFSEENPMTGDTAIVANVVNEPSKMRTVPSYHSAYSEQAKACLMMSDANHLVDSVPGENLMSQSLFSLSGFSRGRRHHNELTPVTKDFLRSSSNRPNRDKKQESNSQVRPTQKRAVSMTRLDQLAQPRRRFVDSSNSAQSPVSPTRPISSISNGSESGSVKMRSKPEVPRKPRPVSIAGINVSGDKMRDTNEDKSNRESRSTEKKSPPTPMIRSGRARSTGAVAHQRLSLVSPVNDSNKFIDNQPKPAPPKKPAHVKAAAAARKVVKQQQASNNQQITPKNEEDLDKTDEAERETDKTVTPTLENDGGSPANNKKEISDEDYKKILAEKRRLAREQAEKEAETERLRLENEQREEEERIRKEEEEHRLQEEEQLRLLEERKRLDEERLQKAIQEQKQKEEEERLRKEEENRLKIEREEKERKAKEEAERQRLELEERLKKDEEERLARKKKLEAIMSRTRKTPNARGAVSPDDNPSPNLTPEPQIIDSNCGASRSREEEKNLQNAKLNDQLKPKPVENCGDSLNEPSQVSSTLNGDHFKSHKPETNPAVDDILDFNGVSPSLPPQTSIGQLINLNYSSNSLQQNNGDVNSNSVMSEALLSSSNQFVSEDSPQTSQEQVADLLS